MKEIECEWIVCLGRVMVIWRVFYIFLYILYVCDFYNLKFKKMKLIKIFEENMEF